MKKLSIIFLLVIVSCSAPKYTYKSPLGLWSRPHPDQPTMPYDTLAYRALWKGDPEAQRQLAERDAQLRKQKEFDNLLRLLQRPTRRYPPTAWELENEIEELKDELERLRSKIRELEEELENK